MDDPAEITTVTHSKAWREGRDVCCAGDRGPGDNPYQRGTSEYQDWHDGWWAAQTKVQGIVHGDHGAVTMEAYLLCSKRPCLGDHEARLLALDINDLVSRRLASANADITRMKEECGDDGVYRSYTDLLLDVVARDELLKQMADALSDLLQESLDLSAALFPNTPRAERITDAEKSAEAALRTYDDCAWCPNGN